MPRHRLACVEHAGDVGAQQLLPALGWKILQRTAELHSGIVDQDVDGADPSFDVCDALRHCRMLGDVERGDIGLVAFGAQCLGGCRELAGVAAVEHDLGAMVGETLRQRQPDTLA